MTPRKQITTTNGITHRHLHHILKPTVLDRVKDQKDSTRSNNSCIDTISVGDSELDEFPYVDFINSPELLSLIERESQSYARSVNIPQNCESLDSSAGTVEKRSVRCDRLDVGTLPASSSKSDASGHLRLTSFVSSSGCCNITSLPVFNSQANSHCRQWTDPSYATKNATIVSCASSSQVVSSSFTSSMGNCGSSSNSSETSRAPRWAEKASDLKYIDDDEEGNQERNSVCSSLPQTRLLSRCRSHSVGHLSAVDIVSTATVTRVGSLREMKRRLILSQESPSKCSHKPKLVQCGKSRSLDSGSVFQEDSKDLSVKGNKNSTVPLLTESSSVDVVVHSPSPSVTPFGSPQPNRKTARKLIAAVLERHRDPPLASRASSLTQLACISPSSTRPSSPLLDRNILASTPPTPKKSFQSHQRKTSLRRKSLLNSPLLSRRSRRGKVVESSDDEITGSGDEMTNASTYRDLENFQKAHIRQMVFWDS